MTKDEALDLALEALENLFGIPDKWTGEGGGDVAVWRLGGSHRAQQAITAIKQARSAPVQDAFAQLMRDAEKTTPAPESIAKYAAALVAGTHEITSLTIRPKRQWVGLTDEEMHECAGEFPWTPTGLKCVRAIEAKLKEKNTP